MLRFILLFVLLVVIAISISLTIAWKCSGTRTNLSNDGWGHDPAYLEHTFSDLKPYIKVYYRPVPKRETLSSIGPNDSDFYGVIVVPEDKIKEIYENYRGSWMRVDLRDDLIPQELKNRSPEFSVLLSKEFSQKYQISKGYRLMFILPELDSIFFYFRRRSPPEEFILKAPPLPIHSSSFSELKNHTPSTEPKGDEAGNIDDKSKAK